MLNKIHPDIREILVARSLLAFNKKMAKNIGRRVAFIGSSEEIRRKQGSSGFEHTFTVIGIQKDYRGSLAYRVTCNGFLDSFGKCALPDEITFLD